MRMHDFQPRRRKNYFVTAVTWIFEMFAVSSIFLRDRIGIDFPTACIFTGLGTLMVLIELRSRRTGKQNYRQSKFLREQQDEIGTDDYSGAGIFFDGTTKNSK